ncbi:hypothetical protein EVG20_g4009 [Dentipellis fragilis]|uniref:Uncharacterized protein n=1 Tax=Dentipellis fragilis TaxID=205917 RepID=A0A4Y9Z0A2_9AGAM|nr:hypothetical protein EVG20_g4009 [Dentipellis fragilis]
MPPAIPAHSTSIVHTNCLAKATAAQRATLPRHMANPPPSALCSLRLPLGRCRRLDGGVAMSVFAVRVVFPRICHGFPLCPTERSIQWVAAPGWTPVLSSVYPPPWGPILPQRSASSRYPGPPPILPSPQTSL